MHSGMHACACTHKCAIILTKIKKELGGVYAAATIGEWKEAQHLNIPLACTPPKGQTRPNGAASGLPAPGARADTKDYLISP